MRSVLKHHWLVVSCTAMRIPLNIFEVCDNLRFKQVLASAVRVVSRHCLASTSGRLSLWGCSSVIIHIQIKHFTYIPIKGESSITGVLSAPSTSSYIFLLSSCLRRPSVVCIMYTRMTSAPRAHIGWNWTDSAAKVCKPFLILVSGVAFCVCTSGEPLIVGYCLTGTDSAATRRRWYSTILMCRT